MTCLYKVAAVAAVAGVCAPVLAQTATLHGFVLDSAGRPVSGAAVTVLQGSTAVSEQMADGRGAFSFQAPPREYVLHVSAPGFAELNTSPVPFSVRGVSRFTLLRPGESRLEQSPVQQASAHQGLEYGVLIQGGVGTEDRSDFHFLLAGVHGGRMLTSNLGRGWLQGNFEYAVEAFPFWQAYTPEHARVSCSADPPAAVGTYTCSAPFMVGGTYTGVSVTPIILRWNLTHGKRLMPWVQGAGGVVWTNHKFPAIGNTNALDTASNGPHGDSSVWNFTPQFGIGLHYFAKPRRSVDFSASAVHLSSASLGDKNPGVNASVQFSVGYTWWK